MPTFAKLQSRLDKQYKALRTTDPTIFQDELNIMQTEAEAESRAEETEGHRECQSGIEEQCGRYQAVHLVTACSCSVVPIDCGMFNRAASLSHGGLLARMRVNLGVCCSD